MINIQIWRLGRGDTLQGFAKLSFLEELQKQMFCLVVARKLCLLKNIKGHKSLWDTLKSYPNRKNCRKGNVLSLSFGRRQIVSP